VRRTTGTTALQIPITQLKPPNDNGFDPAVSSPEYYLTPAPSDDAIRKALLVGRHLIILNNGSHYDGTNSIPTLTPVLLDAEPSTTLYATLWRNWTKMTAHPRLFRWQSRGCAHFLT
jgi:hypothetical protein